MFRSAHPFDRNPAAAPLQLLAWLVCGWLVFSLWRLGSPDYSADEALFAVKAFDFWAKVEAGRWPGWNPVSDYLGPLDTWWAAAVDWAHRKTGGTVPWNPAMMRLGPFALFCTALVLFALELRARSDRLALIWLVIMACTPMVWIYARIGWAATWGLGLMTLAWRESLRAERTATMHWWRLATLCGLSVWAHPNYLFGCVVVVLPRWRLLASDLTRNAWVRVAGAGVWGGLLTLPILRNGSISAPSGESFGTLTERLWALVEIVGGRRPIEWQMVHDPGGLALTVCIALCSVGLIIWRYTMGPRDAARRLEFWVVLGISVILFAFARGNRDLTVLGHERYLLSLLPAWIWLLSESAYRFAIRMRCGDSVLALALLTFAVSQGYRLSTAVNRQAETPPSLQQASDWLERRCPKTSCLALAEDFWDYWAFRFYSRDRYDLNVWGANWRGGPTHARKGREMAGCWREPSQRPYHGSFREKREFPGKGSASVSEVCYSGIDETAF